MQSLTSRYYQSQQHKVPHRGLKWIEFPTTGYWSVPMLDYLYDHNLSPQAVTKLDTIYPSLSGICFILIGGERLQDFAYQERLLPSHTLPNGVELRWRNPTYTSLDQYVYVPWTWEEVNSMKDEGIFLVEGCTDALRISLAGHLSIGLLGVGLTDGRKEVIHKIQAKVEQIKGIHTIPLWFIPDNDGPGERLVGRITREFGCRVIRLPHNHKDVCNLTDEELQCILKVPID